MNCRISYTDNMLFLLVYIDLLLSTNDYEVSELCEIA